MPHIDLKFSNDLQLDAKAYLGAVEKIIHNHDTATGECKGRAYPADVFHHSHCFLEIFMLPKSHRDAAYTQELQTKLKAEMENQLGQPCIISVGIQYTHGEYLTEHYTPA